MPGNARTIAADVKLPGYAEVQVQRAVASLLKFVGDNDKDSKKLFDDDETISVSIALKKMPLQSRKDKPIPLELPHPLHTPEGAEICLFVKDHKGEGHKEGKLQVQKFEKSGGVTKVIGISKLKTKYESHEAKRQLCKMYDIFLADERILPSLPKLIGKSFFKKKKQPIPIRLTAKDLPAQIKKACACTYMFKNSGTSINIKVAFSSFSQEQIVENVHAALVAAVEHVPKKWGNVRGVFLKTADSVALPLFQSLPEGSTKIAGAPGEQEGKIAGAADEKEGKIAGAPAEKEGKIAGAAAEKKGKGKSVKKGKK